MGNAAFLYQSHLAAPDRASRTNSFRQAQKTTARAEQSVGGGSKKTHYWQRAKNRLFCCRDRHQAAELRKLCGKAITFMDLPTVDFRRRSLPFAEEIDLCR